MAYHMPHTLDCISKMAYRGGGGGGGVVVVVVVVVVVIVVVVIIIIIIIIVLVIRQDTAYRICHTACRTADIA